MKPDRPLVEEHRVTIRRGHLVIRLWIEADPAHGGITYYRDAVAAAKDAELQLAHGLGSPALNPTPIWGPPDALARWFLSAVPAANSVEVCDLDGNGTAVHRDWP